MTASDRIVLIVIVAVAALAGFWFLAVSPKRAESKKQDAALATAQQRLTTAEASASSATAAKQRYANDYATVARLGKAVPVDDDVPSLVYQLQSTAAHENINFRSIQLSTSGASAAPAAAATQSAAVASTTGATPASTASTASSALPPGATVGAAGFPTMPFSFTFDGSFFRMGHFLHQLDELTKVGDDSISVKGRLLTVDGVALKAGPKGFPDVTTTVAVTAYLLPSDEGLTAGATAGAAPSTGTASPAGTTPTASLIGSDR
jgi:hypothetical protein